MEADMKDPHLRCGHFLADVVFRGAHYGNMELPGSKEDFQLIPKEQEKFYLDRTLPKGQKWRADTVVPKFVELPPLLKEMLIQEAREKGVDFKEEEMKLPYIIKEASTFSHVKYE